MRKTKPKPPLRELPVERKHDALLNAAVRLLENKGWRVAVIGGISVRQPFNALKHNYELTINFTGSKD